MRYGRNTFNAFFVEPKINAIQIRTSTAVLLGFSIVRFFRFLEICIAHCRGGWQVGHVESEKHMNAKIYLSSNGNLLGEVENFPSDRYENAVDNAEGHVRADAVLDESDVQALGLTGNETVYALLS